MPEREDILDEDGYVCDEAPAHSQHYPMNFSIGLFADQLGRATVRELQREYVEVFVVLLEAEVPRGIGIRKHVCSIFSQDLIVRVAAVQRSAELYGGVRAAVGVPAQQGHVVGCVGHWGVVAARGDVVCCCDVQWGCCDFDYRVVTLN